MFLGALHRVAPAEHLLLEALGKGLLLIALAEEEGRAP